VKASELIVALLWIAVPLFAARAVWTPPPLGPPRAAASCPVPVEEAGEGVACWPRELAHAAGVRAGDRVPSEALVRAVRDGDRARAAREGARARDGPRPRMAPERLAAWRVAVDVNRASAEELASLDGIGPRLAARIVAARPFARIDDVGAVSGVGRHRVERLRARLVLDE
jgi:competence protein ComEA